MKRIGTGKLREENNTKVFQYLIGGKEVTKRDLSIRTGLTFATIGNILNQFMKDEIIIEHQSILPKKGRPTISYMLNANYVYGLNVVIIRRKKRNYIHLRMMDALFHVLYEKKEELVEVTKQNVFSIIKDVLKEYPQIKMIGVGVPAVISNDQILVCDIVEMVGWNLKETIKEETGLLCIVKNDMNFCAVGFHDTLEEAGNLCYVTFPEQSGAGCGIMINGQLLEGEHNIAGEIVYLPFFQFLASKEKGNFHYDEESVAMAVCCLASIINPEYVVLTGEVIENMSLEIIQKQCLKYVPQAFLPQMSVNQDYSEDYFRGIHISLLEAYFTEE